MSDHVRITIPSDLPPVGDASSASTDPRSDVLILQDGERPTVLRDAASTSSGGVVGWEV